MLFVVTEIAPTFVRAQQAYAKMQKNFRVVKQKYCLSSAIVKKRRTEIVNDIFSAAQEYYFEKEFYFLFNSSSARVH